MRLMLAAALMLVAVPALGDQPVVYTGCIQKSNGSLYNVQEGTMPTQPCKSKDKQISWNMAGQPGPPGPPGPSLPRLLQLSVDCNNPGESINAALAQQAERLIVSIQGTCVEQVQRADCNDPDGSTVGSMAERRAITRLLVKWPSAAETHTPHWRCCFEP